MNNIKIVYGIHSVRVLLETAPHTVINLHVQKNREDQRLQSLIKIAEKAGVIVKYISRKELNIFGEKHQGIIAECKNFESLDVNVLQAVIRNRETSVLLLILDGVKDPHNLGACFRSAEALGAQAVIVPKDWAAGITPVVRKVACGAVEMLPFIRVTNLARTIRWLQEQGIWIIGTAADADLHLQDIDLTGDVAIVLGSEGKGIRHLTKECCDFLAQIPLRGSIESLNVSVACGIFLYEVERQRMLINQIIG
ncbi:23S rRNA (guanosine(2251)-2'-O)-methyltransferase RlmB [Coxiella-like endosymbiont of Rhipicephalus sanguineus]|uniref:23S rRNA (guanosine(2251)-2'-O)-methyltransferase RlmB n=1 Tax=Coxiella-like endosymbiont of Rhipicephalus sanguineus TaxID=1955402 RepID=UPI00203FFE8A|nr:23S rRNA (guanosine(2251)-2'-O)-methyltransferase RlmB [Coxiella-like endosymbiont of Rhipicephalus sanguineus]MBT8506473.1 23S rRNA (guanosine(2251)-2'-O)-methyltransferase RlmB [Coxiella-like endosymbiont of Rhipicephalus sanguineus]